jgi:hypothetical protein
VLFKNKVGRAEVWVAKAVKVAEVRWSELPRLRLVFLALGIEGALSGSQGRRFYRVRAPVAGSASRGGCDFRGRHCPRRSKRKRPAPSLGPSSSMPGRFRGCRAAPECVVVADVELITDWGGWGPGVWRETGRREPGLSSWELGDQPGQKAKYWLIFKQIMRAAPRFFVCALACHL